MKFKNRRKRIADILEKLGVAGIALAMFQEKPGGIWVSIIFIVVSIYLTKED